MGFSILARNGLCSIMICCSFWFRLGFRSLSPFFSLPAFPGKPAWVLVLACLPFFSLLCFLRKGVLFHHDVLALRVSGSGAGACLPSSLFFPFSGNGVCSIMVLVPPGSGSGSGACLPSSLYFFLRKGVLCHHDVLVPFGSGSGSFACLPSSLFFLFSGKGFCSIMICWMLLVPARGFGWFSPFFLFPQTALELNGVLKSC